MIGEQFEYGHEICGAVVSVRPKHVKIALWTKNATNREAQVHPFCLYLCYGVVGFLLIHNICLCTRKNECIREISALLDMVYVLYFRGS